MELVEACNWTHTSKHGSRASCLALTGFVAFSKGVQKLTSLSLYAETEQLSRLTSPSGTCHLMMISNHSLDLGGNGDDIAYPCGLNECLLKTQSK